MDLQPLLHICTLICWLFVIYTYIVLQDVMDYIHMCIYMCANIAEGYDMVMLISSQPGGNRKMDEASCSR
jgi:hypothetical protein